MDTQLSLREAQQLILALAGPTEPETVDLKGAAGRIAATALRAKSPVPPFRQSARDGFAVAGRDLAGASPAHPVRLPIVGEIAAGRTDAVRLLQGQTIKIMTGGMVPAGADQVVEFEQCRETDGTIAVSRPGRAGRHIRPAGADLGKGRTLLKAGEIICPEHLALLATAGHDTVEVFQRPQVATLCTGSELVGSAATPQPGQIISGNRFLLDSLVRQAGGRAVDLGMAGDRVSEITAAIRARPADGVRIIITTGGMGPGKYDLLAEAARELGVAIRYRALTVRPGRATLFGALGDLLFFGLPGPPPAVRLLFNELLAPALFKMQGLRRAQPAIVRALLTEAIAVRERGLLNLKNGVLTLRRGQAVVRTAGRLEGGNCVILMPPRRRRLRRGETVTVHTVRSL